MGMGIGINAGHPDEGELAGKQEPVACYVWFTSTGKAMPKRIKYMDRYGAVREVWGIHVLSHKESRYCGIPAVRYECSCEISGAEYLFTLIYYIEKHEWKLLWRD